ncbi:MAG: ABC transporter ATP-binding protein [Chloroflexota bacterium]|nr:ABC transporter ATP-binding protein [Chloroflexota bacterium]
MKSLLRASRFLKPYWLLAAGTFVAMLIVTVSGLVIPRLTQMIIDKGIARGNINLVIWPALAMVGLALLRSLFEFLQGALAARTAQGVAYDMRNILYSKIQSLSFSYHDKAQTGQLLTRATSDVEMVRVFMGMGAIHLVSAFLMIGGAMALLFATDWQLAFILLVIAPFTLSLFGWFAIRGRPIFTQVQQRLADLNTILQENLVGMRVVKAFVREAYEAERYSSANRDLYAVNLRVGRLVSTAMPAIFLMANLGLVAVYWLGGYRVIDGGLTVGEVIAFANYIIMAFFPILMLGMIIAMVSQAGASAERIFEILDTQSEIVELPNAIGLPPIEGRVAFENVSFRYFHSGEWVLRNVEFVAEPGQTVALLGATGSGKSTIINLIPRFYDVTEGRVTIDGYAVRDVMLGSLREQIGIVLQETTLFAGTIRENIAFGRPDASIEDIVEAATAAEAHNFITSFPDGYETRVGERGVTLSGGQKQRIAIARALLLDPRILILDDATSSVDYETEYCIQQALERLMEGRTSFVIAQRIATVLNADLILVLDQGQVVAQGQHEELLRENEIYADIYYSQLQNGQEPPEMVEDQTAKRALPASGIPGNRRWSQ